MRRRWMFASIALALAALALAAQQRTDIRYPDDQAVDMAISEMLAGWQIRDVPLLSRHIAEDVTVVSGVYEPPILGRANYLQAYQTQRQRLQQVQLERRNTFTHFKGNIAWATYQFEMIGTSDGRPLAARGHTTLVLEKRGDRWLIVHNHTSVVPETPAPQQEPAKPGTL